LLKLDHECLFNLFCIVNYHRLRNSFTLGGSTLALPIKVGPPDISIHNRYTISEDQIFRSRSSNPIS